MTLLAFQSIRTDECFDLFWEYLEVRRTSSDVSSPTLPRRRKVPRRFEPGDSAPEYPSTVQDHYRRIYFQAIDLVVAAMTKRFDQKGFQVLQKLEISLTTVEQPQQSEAIKVITSFYGTDLNYERLQTQLHALHTCSGSPLTDVDAVITYLKYRSSAEKEYYCEVIKVVKLILVMPATNAVSERSFSALRRLKTWLRTTTNQARLNWCLMLHVHKDKTDSLAMTSVASEFVERNESRKRIFGQFQ